MRVRFAGVLLTLLVLGMAQASGYPIARGTSEIRPLLGATATLSGQSQPSQFQLGVDWNYSLSGPLGFVLGWWMGFADQYLGMEVHAGVKYRWLRLHPRVAPFIAGGGGVTLGFPTESGGRIDSTLTGIGIRFGGGVDFFPTERIIPGLQILFDLGPRFTPSVRFMGSVQIVAGVGFLL
jgi:hypothetical protein